MNFDQTCCEDVVGCCRQFSLFQVHNIPNGECCGAQAFSRNSVNVLCCNGILNSNVDAGSTCCGNTPYDGGFSETCCGAQVYLKELFDGCCALSGTSPQEYQQFNTRTHLCCDKPIERDSNNKCCYLRQGNGTFLPKSYDFTQFCCAFPYKEITPKVDGQCVKQTEVIATTQPEKLLPE